MMNDQMNDCARLQNWDGVNSLAGLNLAGCDLSHLKLINARLTGSNFYDASLRQANLSGADLTDANLENCDLSYAILDNAILIRARLNGANLTCATLRGAIVNQATFKKATLWDTDLQQALLNEADFSGVHLNRCEMQGASLWKANLQQTYLNDVRLSGANLTEANGQGCEILGVDFTGAYLWRTNFLRARGDLQNVTCNAQNRDGCIFPDGSQIPVHHDQGFISLQPGEIFRAGRAHRQIQVLAGSVWVTSPLGIDETIEAGQTLKMKHGADLLVTTLPRQNAIFIIS